MTASFSCQSISAKCKNRAALSCPTLTKAARWHKRVKVRKRRSWILIWSQSQQIHLLDCTRQTRAIGITQTSNQRERAHLKTSSYKIATCHPPTEWRSNTMSTTCVVARRKILCFILSKSQPRKSCTVSRGYRVKGRRLTKYFGDLHQGLRAWAISLLK